MRCTVFAGGILILIGLAPVRHQVQATEKSPSPMKEKLNTRTITLAIDGMT